MKSVVATPFDGRPCDTRLRISVIQWLRSGHRADDSCRMVELLQTHFSPDRWMVTAIKKYGRYSTARELEGLPARLLGKWQCKTGRPHRATVITRLSPSKLANVATACILWHYSIDWLAGRWLTNIRYRWCFGHEPDGTPRTLLLSAQPLVDLN